MEGGRRPKNIRAFTPPILKNKLCKLFSLDTVKRPVVSSSLASVAFWYLLNASLASMVNVVPTISIT